MNIFVLQVYNGSGDLGVETLESVYVCIFDVFDIEESLVADLCHRFPPNCCSKAKHSSVDLRYPKNVDLDVLICSTV